MTVIKAIILGLIQGLGEFLPISSSGHLSIAGELMGIDPEATNVLSFNIVLHVATLVAVFVVYYKDIWDMILAFFTMVKELFTKKKLMMDTDPKKMVVFLIVGTLPTVVSALLLNHIVENASLLLIGFGLIATSVLLFISEKISREKVDMDNMTPLKALYTGVFQAMAVLPGLSRSGTTTVGGLFCGLKKEFAVKFSFFLSIPAIIGALVFDIKDILELSEQNVTFMQMGLGMIAAFVSGFFAIKVMIKLVSKGKLKVFSYYTVLAGIFSIILYFVK